MNANAPTEPGPATSTSDSAKQSRLAQLGSLLALGISGLALAVGAYQTRLMQVQARASVWPYIAIGYSYHFPTSPNPGYELHVENNGVGPALLKWVRVTLDGQPIQHWEQMVTRLRGKDFPKLSSGLFSGLKGVVIPPSTNRETAISAFQTSDDAVAVAFRDAQPRIGVDICYCSIYGDCWTAHWLVPQPDETAACGTIADPFDY